jgi:ACS family tartrate transporter-like MFS transporter
MAGQEVISTLEQATIVRISLRLLPLLFASYFVAYIDRVNVGFAALSMNKALGLSAQQYGLAAGLFFLGYLFFEIPSNLILARVGARRWIPRIMLSWGLVSLLNAWVSGPYSLYAVRLLLGIGEAGLYPGLLYIVALWYPARYRAQFLGWLIMSTPFSIVFGSLLSQPILMLDGRLGLSGWQWLFILQALPTLVLGVVLIFALPNSPADAQWLPPDQKAWLQQQLAAEKVLRDRVRHFTLFQALTSPTIWLLALGGFGINGAAYGLVLFLPQMIKALGVSTALTPLVNAVPFAITSFVMIFWARHSDKTGERNWHAALPALICAVGLLSCLFLHSPLAIMSALTLGIAGVFCFVSVFWAFPSAMLSGAAAAGGFALINCFANLSSFLGPYVLGWSKDWTGNFNAGLLVIGCGPLLSAGVALSIRSVKRFESAEARP